MKFHLKFSFCLLIQYNKTPLNRAIEKANIEIVELLLSNEKIDINKKSTIINHIF